jgi:hypothetical protein
VAPWREVEQAEPAFARRVRALLDALETIAEGE